MGRFLFYMGFIVIISIKQFSPNVFNRDLTFSFFFVKKKGHTATYLPFNLHRAGGVGILPEIKFCSRGVWV